MLNNFYTLGKVLPPVDDRLRNVINEHYDYLINHQDTTNHTVDPHVAYLSNYNLYRYMREKGFENVQIYPTIVINNFTSFTDFNDGLKELLIPSVAVIEAIKSSMV